MKYIICNEPGSFSLLEKDVPAKKENEALVRISKVGICGTDLHAYQGNQPFFSYPRILGHELAAEIIEVGENEKKLKAGDHVIIIPYLNCGSCLACRRGKTNCCTGLQVLGVHTDGGMQEYCSFPVNILFPSDGLTPEEIALVEPLAIGAHAIRRAQIEQDDTALVIGCGPIGLGIIRQAQLAGARVIVMDINEERLAFVREVFDIEHTVRSSDTSLESILKLNQNELPTIVFDATGNKKALESGIHFMGHGGKYVLVGLYKGELSFHHPLIHSREATILCSRNATLEDFTKVKEMLKNGEFPIDSYITHKVSFSEMIDHFDSWIKPETGVIKAMIEF